MGHEERRDRSIDDRMKAQQGKRHDKEEQGSAAKEMQDDRAGEDQDPEEEGSAGRPQR
ncbi:MAG: hypothetical protein M3Y31_10975 [Gemmatimonadota bacterium]|nr:hypothetical protein [Gemmatimonadota bacterium]